MSATSAAPRAERAAPSRAIGGVWTDVRGLRVFARRAGPEAAPARAGDVVLVHGAVVSSRYLVPLMRELAADFRVHAPDLPGFGRSDRPAAPLDVAGLAEALTAWIRASGLEGAFVVTNSFGCQIVARALAREPSLFVRAVLQGPTYDPGARKLRVTALRWAATGRHERRGLTPILVRDLLDCGPRRALATYRHGLAHRIEDDLARIHVPVLVVRGSEDLVVPQRWAKELTERLRDGRLIVLPGTAHALNYSAPVQLAAVTRAFFGAPPRRRPGVPRAAQESIADFDSATAMLRGTARALHGEGLDGLGAVPRRVAPLAERAVAAVNRLPVRGREAVYRYASGGEAVAPAELHTVSAEAIAAWMVGCYPGRAYPAVVVGSSSGAIAHLAAALGVPFLPQTFLVPVAQREIEPDDPRGGLQAGIGPGQVLLDANPELALHQMHDPNQDRLTLARIAYFRVKRRRLGDALERFLSSSLPRGSTLLVADCRLRWPVTRVGDRQVFQFGALGGITADEFHHGSPRVAAYLRRYGSALRRWDPPPADGQAPEAEWGFDSVLLEDLRDLAHRRGLRLRRIVFDDPEDLSPHVADLYRWWYRRRGRPTGRLLVESFVLFDPWWAIRAGAVPLWLKFAVERSAQRLEDHLAGCEPYDDIRLTLFSHGTDSAGIAPIERWQSILAYAPGRASFFGVDPRRFPQDFASFGRFHRQLRALAVKDRPPDALTLEELDLFIEQGRRYDGVSLIDEEL